MTISERKRNHTKFLASKEWAVIRCDIFTVRGGKCEYCGSKRSLQIHHISYDNFGGNEEPEDLVILCSSCHMLEHGITKPKKIKRAKRKKPKKRKRSLRKRTKDKLIKKALRNNFGTKEHCERLVSAYLI